MPNNQVKLAKKAYKELRSNSAKFKTSQEEYWKAIMSAKTPRWGNLVVKPVIN